ncbi:hypothetical protein JW756_04105 [Candidatus Woesearchaeota archaeon]|nr:hypothetical protein [Candidatus Woesearchaeota archaeon]
MDSETEKIIIHKYLNHRKAFHRDKESLIQEINKFFSEDAPAAFKDCPFAEKFLIEQKTKWYEARVLSLKQMGLVENTAYAYAHFFLKNLKPEPDNYKHLELTKLLETWFEQSCQVVRGVQRIVLAEESYFKRINGLPIGVILADGSTKEHRSLESSVESSVELSLRPIYGRVTEEDKEFLMHYRRKAECFWRRGGLWPYLEPPSELNPLSQPIEGSKYEVFYTGVSDFLLSMIRLIAGAESLLRTVNKKQVS